MKRYIALIAASWLAAVCVVQAQGLDNNYVRIYGLIMEGDSLEIGGQSRQALAKYTEAQSGLQTIKTNNPTWNANVVKFRLDYLQGKIEALADKVAAEDAAPKPAATNTVAEAGTNGVPKPPETAAGTNAAPLTVPATNVPAAPKDWAEQIDGLKATVAQLQEGMGRLETEKGLLEAKLREAFAVQTPAVDPAELARVQAQAKALQKQKDLLEVTLEQWRARTAASTNKAPQTPAEKALADADRQLAQQGQLIAELARERDALQERSRAYGAGGSALPETAGPRGRELEAQLAQMRARLEVLEAQPAPMTSEEAAALKKPDAKPDQGRSIQELSPEAGRLVVQARQYFASGQLDKAEAAYIEVAKLNATNVSVFANLAVIQIELGHVEPADTNIKQALALSPDDPFSAFVLGNLRFRQGKYDEALDALSKAAKLDPANAEVQNYLGLTLSEKGQRAAAESALRKAVELAPNYASAHNNLAVVYITQEPPAVELAKLHYQKARAAGAPINPELEKLIEQKARLTPK
jgi:Flp pilus assembly protein TadD